MTCGRARSEIDAWTRPGSPKADIFLAEADLLPPRPCADPTRSNASQASKRRVAIYLGGVEDVSLPFRPGTISWDVLRRPVFLLGGMRALLLQVADPRIAAGVAEHSDFTNRVFDRMRHTVELMVEVGLGHPADANGAIEEMRRAHRGVAGSLPDGSRYDAADPELRLWVLSTLIDTVLAVEEVYVGEFGEEERRRYYRESLEVAQALEVSNPPSDLKRFRRYVDERIAGLAVTGQANEIAHHVLHPDFGWMPSWFFAPFRVVTTDLLPDRLRHDYGLIISPGQVRWLRRFQAASRATLPKMPNWIRTFPLLRPIGAVRDRIFGSRVT